jgi:hypothetical protein
MSVFITLSVSLTKYETITFIMHLAATNSHMCPLISSLSTVGVDKCIIICQKSRANYYTHICILSFCHILGSYWTIKSSCWLAYFTMHSEYIVRNASRHKMRTKWILIHSFCVLQKKIEKESRALLNNHIIHQICSGQELIIQFKKFLWNWMHQFLVYWKHVNPNWLSCCYGQRRSLRTIFQPSNHLPCILHSLPFLNTWNSTIVRLLYLISLQDFWCLWTDPWQPNFVDIMCFRNDRKSLTDLKTCICSYPCGSWRVCIDGKSRVWGRRTED